MSRSSKKTHAITPWKNVAFYLCIMLFLLSLVHYITSGIYGDGQWLWPLLFVPLMLYFLGIMYGDAPSRFYQLSGLQPFPIPFSMQFDRAVLAIVLLFSGITLNAILLIFSLVFRAPPFLSVLYVVYMMIVLLELPHSIRIFRYLQHIQIMRMTAAEPTELFINTASIKPDESQTHGVDQNPAFLERLFQELKSESQSLVQEYSPLGKEQQYALNLAVRAGEAVWEARASFDKEDSEKLETNLNIIYALCKHADMEPPADLNDLTKGLKVIKEGKKGDESVPSPQASAN